ncbi:MAG: CsiV family protein [Gammaproteobacteria bacterium]
MKLPLISRWLLIFLIVPLLAQAAGTSPVSTRAPNWYDVELIVFRYTDPSAGSLETWPLNPGLPDWDSAVPPNPTGSGLPYMQLPPSSFRLTSDWQKLARSPDYQPLLQVAWTQPAIDRATALFVRIGTPPATLLAVGATTTPVAASSTDAGTPVYGIARLSTTGPYLHFDLDLVYRGSLAKVSIPGTTTAITSGNTAPQFQWYQLVQDRRIDAGKLNYFDQPLFGVLVLVTPSKAQQ